MKAISTRLLCQPRGRTFTIAKFLWRLGASLDWHLIHRPADFSLKAVLIKRIVVPCDRPARHVNTLPKIESFQFLVLSRECESRSMCFVVRNCRYCLADRHRGSSLETETRDSNCRASNLNAADRERRSSLALGINRRRLMTKRGVWKYIEIISLGKYRHSGTLWKHKMERTYSRIEMTKLSVMLNENLAEKIISLNILMEFLIGRENSTDYNK